MLLTRCSGSSTSLYCQTSSGGAAQKSLDCAQLQLQNRHGTDHDAGQLLQYVQCLTDLSLNLQ